MIVSASRRTDVPRFYFDWLANRLAAGFAMVRNPMNSGQIRRIDLTPEAVDCLVLWSKNPRPMLNRLDSLRSYPYYLQFTINPYGRELECNLPGKDELLATFKALAGRIGPERVVWRYSPVFYTAEYPPERHLEFFGRLAADLSGHTRQCHLSFLDLYAKIRPAMRRQRVDAGDPAANLALAKQFQAIAAGGGIELSACGDAALAAGGIPAARCVDDRLIAQISGRATPYHKDPGQRGDCRCTASVDIGRYDTCLNGCCYCYANTSVELAARRHRDYEPEAPMLCDRQPLPPPDLFSDT